MGGSRSVATPASTIAQNPLLPPPDIERRRSLPLFTCNPSATVRRYVIRVPDFGGDRSPSLPLPAPGHEVLCEGDPVLLPGKACRWLTDTSPFALRLQPRVPSCAQGSSLPRGCASVRIRNSHVSHSVRNQTLHYLTLNY